MSRWIRITYDAGIQGQVMQVSDAVASAMATDAEVGTAHKTYAVEDFGKMKGADVMPGTIVVHWEDVASVVGYDYNPYE